MENLYIAIIILVMVCLSLLGYIMYKISENTDLEIDIKNLNGRIKKGVLLKNNRDETIKELNKTISGLDNLVSEKDQEIRYVKKEKKVALKKANSKATKYKRYFFEYDETKNVHLKAGSPYLKAFNDTRVKVQKMTMTELTKNFNERRNIK